jgi:hypothetical protein
MKMPPERPIGLLESAQACIEAKTFTSLEKFTIFGKIDEVGTSYDTLFERDLINGKTRSYPIVVAGLDKNEFSHLTMLRRDGSGSTIGGLIRGGHNSAIRAWERL